MDVHVSPSHPISCHVMSCHPMACSHQHDATKADTFHHTGSKLFTLNVDLLRTNDSTMIPRHYSGEPAARRFDKTSGSILYAWTRVQNDTRGLHGCFDTRLLSAVAAPLGSVCVCVQHLLGTTVVAVHWTTETSASVSRGSLFFFFSRCHCHCGIIAN